MKRATIAVMSAMLAGGAVPCPAEPACTAVAVRASVEAAAGRVTLADLLEPDVCRPLYKAAARVSLGAAPSAGTTRVLEGGEIRHLIEEMEERGLPKNKNVRIPDRIMIRRAGRMKSCADIARFLVSTASAQAPASSGRPIFDRAWKEHLECAAARSIPEDSTLEFLRTEWNARLQRWEFTMRCTRPQECVPFLVWARADNPPPTFAQFSSPTPPNMPEAGGNGMAPLVKPGQTASLTWEQAGIRITLPVTCLDGGGLGEFVRVRFKNAAGTLRAEVMGAGTLWAGL